MTNKEKNVIEFNINFGGFYESNASYMIDNAIANYFNVDDIDSVNESDIENIDYKAMQNEYGEQWLDLYKEILPFGVGYVGIESPEYYNFETDKIIARTHINTVNRLIDELQHNYDFIEWLDDASASYDGFNSYYQGFDQVKTNKAVFMTYYTDYLSENNKDDINDFIYDIWVDVEFNKQKHLYTA